MKTSPTPGLPAVYSPPDEHVTSHLDVKITTPEQAIEYLGLFAKNGDETFEAIANLIRRLHDEAKGTREGKIILALFEYHHDLDLRKHGGVAQDRLVKEIEKIFNRPWVQGATIALG